MIQAIQVLRFHLLELEKVNIVNLHVGLFLTCGKCTDATCTNVLCVNGTDIIERASVHCFKKKIIKKINKPTCVGGRKFSFS